MKQQNPQRATNLDYEEASFGRATPSHRGGTVFIISTSLVVMLVDAYVEYVAIRMRSAPGGGGDDPTFLIALPILALGFIFLFAGLAWTSTKQWTTPPRIRYLRIGWSMAAFASTIALILSLQS